MSSQSFGRILGDIGSAVTGIPGLGDIFGKDEKKSEMSGEEAGSRNREYLQASYPGTTPWEQLHASSSYGSGGGSTSNEFENQRYMQNQELKVRASVADKQARASIIAAGANGGPDVVDALLGAYKGVRTPKYDSQTQQARERLNKELPGIDAESKAKIQKVVQEEINTQMLATEKQIQKSKQTQQEYDTEKAGYQKDQEKLMAQRLGERIDKEFGKLDAEIRTMYINAGLNGVKAAIQGVGVKKFGQGTLQTEHTAYPYGLVKSKRTTIRPLRDDD